MSRAMEEMERKRDAREAVQTVEKLMKWIDEELIPFLKDRQDADGWTNDIDAGYTPNEEMTLLSDLEAILGRSGRPF